ncbi:MAG: type II toxin-antitoxin system death-on-curing family toxin [Acidimicrobiia bacterium]|nr:type II toxin-antitoxin system death-on-curing family toxin [Acidimicrobiia bacterium]NNL13645.1 type II toxin-antitoxin system death-on-curing family toxin [Acidimicrobiia bacterium]NNL98931.1 type II toxin-antitoxin system death-on-curing family toxin [Acidimicrobiia bacterium]RZV44662.1 MAG: type II toxin-antitoxin system death-on-curing family toxin [Acidimicrobiia bacterium]
MGEYLTVIEVLSIHGAMIDEFGGTDGIRDLGALESAVFRPQTGYYEGPVEEAAALMQSLLQNHPFLDGNKRTAFAAADLHLRLNGLRYSGTPFEAIEFMDALFEDNTVDTVVISKFLRAHYSKL